MFLFGNLFVLLTCLKIQNSSVLFKFKKSQVAISLFYNIAELLLLLQV